MAVITTTLTADTLIGAGQAGELAESPLWHPGEQALYWVDIARSQLCRLQDEQARPDVWALPEQPGCLALGADGELVIAGAQSVFSVRPVVGQPIEVLRHLADIPHDHPDMRANDGRCDRQGRLWFSSMKARGERAAVGRWYRFDRRGMHVSAMQGFATPNGSAFSPDGRRMYVAESAAAVRSVWVMDYDVASGECGERKLFIDFHQHVGRPDGACVDADGCYWVCATEAGQLMRFTPQGVLDRVLVLPFRSPTMPCFGGSDMRTLYVASLRRTTQKSDEDPFAGCMLAYRLETGGLKENELDV